MDEIKILDPKFFSNKIADFLYYKPILMYTKFLSGVITSIPAVRKQRQVHLCEFKVSMIYIVNFRLPRTT